MDQKQKQQFEQIISEGYSYSSPISLEKGLKVYRSGFKVFALYALIIPLTGSLFSAFGLGWGGFFVHLLFVLPLLDAGFYLGAEAVIKGEKLEYRHLFEARHYAVPIVLNNLFSYAIYAILLTPIYFLFEKTGMWEFYGELLENPTVPPEPPVFTSPQSTTFLLTLVPLVFLQVSFSWAFPLILSYKSDALSALDQSRRLVGKKWFTQFMLLSTFFSIFFLGSFLVTMMAGFHAGLANIAVFALFLIFPWVYCSLYVGFREATALMRSPEEEKE